MAKLTFLPSLVMLNQSIINVAGLGIFTCPINPIIPYGTYLTYTPRLDKNSSARDAWAHPIQLADPTLSQPSSNP